MDLHARPRCGIREGGVTRARADRVAADNRVPVDRSALREGTEAFRAGTALGPQPGPDRRHPGARGAARRVPLTARTSSGASGLEEQSAACGAARHRFATTCRDPMAKEP